MEPDPVGARLSFREEVIRHLADRVFSVAVLSGLNPVRPGA
jgi:hypothetical protein